MERLLGALFADIHDEWQVALRHLGQGSLRRTTVSLHVVPVP